ncbi:hypothetical protein EKPJFOCH_2072 [Methylobacterium thuringiense]|uniref:Secreted protein n=1 Tax=Methylobacterium thuringiense TaxID=1003091 RepID=A0ABQ4TLQ3_9HYPH|nr:hypothetical protein EKPJFOCH_2072 [Methylobacterium thuringiense]
MPNLFSDLPVAILACVSASTSGFTRIETGASRPTDTATSDNASSSGSLSTLKQKMPARKAAAISSRVLPTPENTILSAGTPAANARRSSPSETMSMPAPSRARVASTAWFEFAFTAKQVRASSPANASENTV